MDAQSTTNRQTLPMPAIDRLFQRLSANYGKHFHELWKGIPIAEVKLEWSQELAQFSNQQLGDALAYVLENNKFPPTLPEFRILCKQHKREPVRQALPRKFTAEELQANRKRLADIMAGLGKKMRMEG
jgi:hypothetical protein